MSVELEQEIERLKAENARLRAGELFWAEQFVRQYADVWDREDDLYRPAWINALESTFRQLVKTGRWEYCGGGKLYIRRVKAVHP